MKPVEAKLGICKVGLPSFTEKTLTVEIGRNRASNANFEEVEINPGEEPVHGNFDFDLWRRRRSGVWI